MTNEAINNTVKDRAIELLQNAYAEGRINEPELERRLDLVMTATSYPQLRLAVQDIPAPTPSLSSAPQRPSPSPRPGVPSPRSADKAAFVHLSGLISGPVGPGIAWALTDKKSALNREAVKALNFQILSVIAFAGGTFLSWIGFSFPISIWTIIWLILTVVGGIKASRGEDWENPATQITGFRPIK